MWGFLALGCPTRSVSRRVVKLAVPYYYSGCCHPQKGDEIRMLVVFIIPSTGNGLGFGGRGMHNGCDFAINQFTEIGQTFLHSHYEILHSTVTRRLLHKKGCLVHGVQHP